MTLEMGSDCFIADILVIMDGTLKGHCDKV